MQTSMANRPALGASAQQMRSLAHGLANNTTERAAFLADPASYLRKKSIGVRSCSLAAARFATTSEVITTPANTYVVQNTYQQVAVVQSQNQYVTSTQAQYQYQYQYLVQNITPYAEMYYF